MTSRRDFVKASLGSLVALQTSCGLRHPAGRRSAWPDVQGTIGLDEASLREAADDWGHGVVRRPMAVLKPASLEDVASIVRHANATQMRVALRGRGHCAYGQAQVPQGIVIDSRPLNGIRWTNDDEVMVDAGASWDDVAVETLARGVVPPVMTDMQLLSVGGTLSAGGTGEVSHRLGAQVDHVSALEVVTGAGEIVWCSAAQNRELFEMTLAGMGQCAVIGRASLRLMPAPQEIVIRRLRYESAEELIEDTERLATEYPCDTLGGEVTRSGASWRMELLVGTFISPSTPDSSALPGDLRGRCANAPARMSYLAWLRRRTRSVVAALDQPQPNAPIVLMLPSADAGRALASLLSAGEASSGTWRIEVLPMVTARFTRPLFRLPDAPFAFSLRVQRRASARNAPDHLQMLRHNDALVETSLPRGATIYPPFAPPLSRRNWQFHFGPAWQRLVAAKRRYDPKHVLTPGPGMFD